MKPLRRAWHRLAGSFVRGRRDADLAAEFDFHVDMLAEENRRRGMPPAEARRAALLTFGGVETAKENYRDQRGFPTLDSVRQDIVYALRGMRRSPILTCIVVACLALGIGANTAIFSLFNAVMIRSLPVAHPEQLVFFRYSNSGGDMSEVRRTTTGAEQRSLPYATYESFRDHARTLAGVFVFVSAGIGNNGLTIDLGGQPFTADGEMVTGRYFSVLGISPVLGRAIVESDFAPDAPNIALISHAFWFREFKGQSSAIGRNINVNGAPFTIVGVAPPGFVGLSGGVPDLWFPLRPSTAVKPWGSRAASSDTIFADRKWWWCGIGGRARPGNSPEEVLAETGYLFRQSITAGLPHLPQRLPALIASNTSPAFESMRRKFAMPLRILIVTAALVLFMASANVATLLLARAKARQKEIGVRLAIGASRARVVRQLLTESVLLSGCGGLLGLLLAYRTAPALLALIVGTQHATPLDVSPDLAVLAFAAAVSLGTGILFGLAPAFRAVRRDLAPQLMEAAASTTPRGNLARVLVASQVALSVVLLFGAGLFVRTFRNLDSQDLGFDRDNLLLFEVDPERSGYTGSRALLLNNQLADEIGKLAGVRSVTYSQEALLTGFFNSTPTATDGAPLPPGQPNEDYYNRVGPRFFETMGMRVLAGRGIELRDTDGGRPAAVVNETWARTYFPGENPVGHLLTPGSDRFNPQKAYEIVGVAADAKYNQMRNAPPRTVYISTGATWDRRPRRMCFVVRSAVAPATLAGQLREAIRQFDPTLPLFNVRTQRQQIERAMGTERTLAHISGFFGAAALLLVAIGVYGTLSHAVIQRTGEIGIRMALGARQAEVVWMILRESLVVAAFGLAAGLPSALALSRLAASSLFGVTAHDAVTIGVTVVILSVITAISGFLPAKRASRIDPIRALRHE
jgi:predicted permease